MEENLDKEEQLKRIELINKQLEDLDHQKIDRNRAFSLKVVYFIGAVISVIATFTYIKYPEHKSKQETTEINKRHQQAVILKMVSEVKEGKYKDYLVKELLDSNQRKILEKKEDLIIAIAPPKESIQPSSATGFETIELREIYDAIGYDSESDKYIGETKPIEWKRVHNLPDLAYFNHSKNIKDGEIDCEKCHQESKEIDSVYQYADLTMGWCINCHREVEISEKANDYYEKLIKLREEKTKKPMKVEDTGGLECEKCHY